MAGDAYEVEIGYMIAPVVAGRGYATEATATLIDAIFNLTEARVLIASSRVVNPASRRVLEKCGFAFSATAQNAMPARGGEVACDFFQLDRHRWSARGARGTASGNGASGARGARANRRATAVGGGGISRTASWFDSRCARLTLEATHAHRLPGCALALVARHDRRHRATVLRPARDVVAGRDGPLLAVGDRAHA